MSIHLCFQRFFATQIIFLFGYWPINILFSQETIGLVSDNYLPVNQAQINPALLADPKVWLDIQIAGASVFAMNNYVYAPESRLIQVTEIENIDLNTSINNAKAYANAQILGPSASICLGKNTVGLQTSLRAYGSLNNLPPILTETTNPPDLDIQEGKYTVSNVRTKYMSWAQFGISYSRLLKTKKHSIWQAGATLNYLVGIGNISININSSDFEYFSTRGTLLNLNGKYSYAEHAFGAGKGFGGSIGVTYKYMKENVDHYVPHSKKSNCKKPAYLYRLGLSLIDLGYVTFDENYMYGSFNTTSTLEELEQVINGGVTNNPSNTSTTYLPTALSFQYDHNIAYGIYAGGGLVQRISSAKNYNVERSNLLYGNIRIERRWLGAGIPLSFVDYKHYQLGLWLRLGILNIGTDHIIPIFLKSKIYSANAYMSIHIPLFKSPFCKQHTGKRKDPTSCPDW